MGRKLTEAEKAERRIRRKWKKENARRAEELGPLFASQAEPYTLGDAYEADRRMLERRDAHQRRLRYGHWQTLLRGHAYRGACQDLLTPEVLADLDRRRAACPDGPEYAADLYGRACGRLARP